jgi:hypothetical protein
MNHSVISLQFNDKFAVVDQGDDGEISLAQSIQTLLKVEGESKVVISDVSSSLEEFLHSHCRDYKREVFDGDDEGLSFLALDPKSNLYFVIDGSTLNFFPKIFLGFEFIDSYKSRGLVPTILEFYEDLSDCYYDIENFGELFRLFASEYSLQVTDDFVNKYSRHFILDELDTSSPYYGILVRDERVVKMSTFAHISGKKDSGDNAPILVLIGSILATCKDRAIEVESLFSAHFSFDYLELEYDKIEVNEMDFNFGFYSDISSSLMAIRTGLRSKI